MYYASLPYIQVFLETKVVINISGLKHLKFSFQLNKILLPNLIWCRIIMTVFITNRFEELSWS